MSIVGMVQSVTAIAGVLCLAACASTNGPEPTLRTGSASDENACLSAVARETNSSGVVLSSDFSQAATIVMVGVGPDRAQWRCLVSGGKVSEVGFTGDEGAM